jgi:hypothetical protein
VIVPGFESLLKGLMVCHDFSNIVLADNISKSATGKVGCICK